MDSTEIARVATKREAGSLWQELPTDTMEIVFEGLGVNEYNAFRLVCKLWHTMFLHKKWYGVVRRNTLLPITSKGQSHAMCKNNCARYVSRVYTRSYEDNPWGDHSRCYLRHIGTWMY